MRAGLRLPSVRQVPDRLLILATLLLGFGLVFTLWLFSTYLILVQLSDVDNRITNITRRLTDPAGVAQARADLAPVYRLASGQVFVVNALTLLGSLFIAALATRETWLLEARLRRQLDKDAQNTRDLRELSARLVEAQEQERRRIGSELHDEIGQALTAIKVEIALAERDAGLSGCAQALARLKPIVDRTLHSVRDVSRLLHPLDLDDLGLPDALASYAQEFSQRTGVKTSFTSDELPAHLPPEIEICIYRIVQEALTNVARHAAAARCRVELRKQDGGISLSVEDDGKGFDARSPSTGSAPRGFGLLGVRERVSGFGGDFRIETGPGKGTRLTVRLPVSPAAAGWPGLEVAGAQNANSPR